jgi:hypothetical protein
MPPFLKFEINGLIDGTVCDDHGGVFKNTPGYASLIKCIPSSTDNYGQIGHQPTPSVLSPNMEPSA